MHVAMDKLRLAVALLLGHMACCGGQDNSGDDGSQDDAGCLPKLADQCFSDLYNDISHFLTKDSASPEELCNATYNGIDCSSTIIDGDCNASDGRGNFDIWMDGLNAVYESFCQEPYESLKLLTQNKKCWDLLEFVTCVEEETKLKHVIDLLQQPLDLNSCNYLLVSMAVCNARATHTATSCKDPQRAITEMLHTFFTATKCGLHCSGQSTPQLATLAFITTLTFFFLSNTT